MANVKVGDCVTCSLDSSGACYEVLNSVCDLFYTLKGNGPFDFRVVLVSHLRKIEG